MKNQYMLYVFLIFSGLQGMDSDYWGKSQSSNNDYSHIITFNHQNNQSLQNNLSNNTESFFSFSKEIKIIPNCVKAVKLNENGVLVPDTRTIKDFNNQNNNQKQTSNKNSSIKNNNIQQHLQEMLKLKISSQIYQFQQFNDKNKKN